MLEQAIIDATSLREAALKNAQSKILEQYSSQVKEALTQLLEAGPEPELPSEDVMPGDAEPDLGMMGAPAMDNGTAAPELTSQMNPGALGGNPGG
jgi:hypothetical protein